MCVYTGLEICSKEAQAENIKVYRGGGGGGRSTCIYMFNVY